MGLAAEIEACERAVWQALLSGDAAADGALLSENFLGVYPDGFAGRADHAAQLEAGPSVADYRLSDLKILPLGPDHALIAYRADYRRFAEGAVEAMYVSSIWQWAPGGWRNIFSQDTPATGQPTP